MTQGIDRRKGYQMNPPPSHVGVAEEFSSMGHVSTGHELQVKKSFAQDEFCS